MFFIKKLLLGLAAVILIYIGGNGTQSSNVMVQGTGFIGILVGFVILYIFGKMIWRAMGCLSVLFIIGLVVSFVLYAIGAFNGGVNEIIPNVQNFLGIGSNKTTQKDMLVSASQDNEEPSLSAPLLNENFDDIKIVEEITENENQNNRMQPVNQAQPIEKSDGLNQLINSLTKNKTNTQEQQTFNPNNYPAIYGVTRVINGDTLEMRGKYIKIYAIDAPESNQSCADYKGRAYRCGQEAAKWLKSWISGHELECHILKQDSKGNMIATCSLGQYDIGAAMVNAGWAVADPSQNDIYVPYQQQAINNRRGLWQGQFYMPWDWREIQSKKAKIKVIKPKNSHKSLFDF